MSQRNKIVIKCRPYKLFLLITPRERPFQCMTTWWTGQGAGHFLGRSSKQQLITHTLLRRGSCDSVTKKNWKEPLPNNTGIMEQLFFRDFIILLSQITSFAFKRTQKKSANVLLKSSNLKLLFPEIRGSKVIPTTFAKCQISFQFFVRMHI